MLPLSPTAPICAFNGRRLTLQGSPQSRKEFV
jgi:hypothetical protein